MRKNRALWVFVGLLAIFAGQRLTLLLEFPYGFLHPDSAEYFTTVQRFLLDGTFIPSPTRTNGLYAVLLIVLAKTFGGSSLPIVMLQHTLGLATLALVGRLAGKITGSATAAVLAFLVAGLLPRQILYEHALLADSLYTFLLIALASLAWEWRQKPSLSRAIGIGVLAGMLILCRGQGMIAPFAGVILFTSRGWRVAARSSVAMGVAITILVAPFVAASYRHHHLKGLSISGSFNLFLVGTFDLIDFDSARHQAFKDRVRACALESNRNFDGNMWWAMRGRDCQDITDATYAQRWMKWDEIDRTYSQLALEGIRKHPVSFLYRVGWNAWDFVFFRTHTADMLDLASWLLRGHRPGIAFAPPARPDFPYWSTRTVPPAITQPLGWGGRSIEVMVRHLGGTLTNARFFLLGTYLFLLAAILFGAPSLSGWLFFVLLGQIALTVIPVNALYDRYYLPVEALQVVLLACAVTRLREATRREQWRFAATACGLAVVTGLAFVSVDRLTQTTHWVLESRIVGRTPEALALVQGRVVGGGAASILFGLAVWWLATHRTRVLQFKG